ncbi:MAG: aspartate aminotransferase family protein [Pseudomonadota bacterium]
MPYTDPSNVNLSEQDKRHHIHPFTDPKYFDTREVLVIHRAEGCSVFDREGNKILDGMAGLWCVNVGYGRQELVDAAANQMQALAYYNTFFQSATPPQIQLSAKLAELTPEGLDHFFFANSGSEANDTIIRLVRHYWKTLGQPEKRYFIGREKAYHGSTLAAVSLGGMPAMHAFDHQTLPEFAHIQEPHWYAHGGDMSEEAFGRHAAHELEKKILEIGPEKVAAFIGEPIQGAGGVIDPPMTYWGEIQAICRKYDILLVADEVICGFGRTGEWFGSNYYGIEPDIMTLAKGLSSGYLPVSAVAFSDKINNVLHEGGPIVHGYTYSGHPVSCAVALANINLIEREGLVERVRDETAPYFRQCLNELAAEYPIIGEVRGVGLLAALELVRDRDSKTPFADDEHPAIICRDHCLEAGLIMRAVGDAMILCPPLIISRDEIDLLVERAAIGLRKTAQHFGL